MLSRGCQGTGGRVPAAGSACESRARAGAHFFLTAPNVVCQDAPRYQIRYDTSVCASRRGLSMVPRLGPMIPGWPCPPGPSHADIARLRDKYDTDLYRQQCPNRRNPAATRDGIGLGTSTPDRDTREGRAPTLRGHREIDAEILLAVMKSRTQSSWITHRTSGGRPAPAPKLGSPRKLRVSWSVRPAESRRFVPRHGSAHCASGIYATFATARRNLREEALVESERFGDHVVSIVHNPNLTREDGHAG